MFLLQKKEQVLPLAECLKPSKYFLMRYKQLQVFDCCFCIYLQRVGATIILASTISGRDAGFTVAVEDPSC